MKKISPIYRILALSLAFLMFFTSVGFTVDMHYCKGQLKTFNFFGKAKTCHEIGEGMKNCPHHQKMMKASTESKKGCCSNETLHFQLDQDQQIQGNPTLTLNPQLQYFVLAFVEVFLNGTAINSESPSYGLYKPPIIPRDIYVLLETYRL